MFVSAEAAESGDNGTGEVVDGEEPGDGGDEEGPGGREDFPQTAGGGGGWRGLSQNLVLMSVPCVSWLCLHVSGLRP